MTGLPIRMAEETGSQLVEFALSILVWIFAVLLIAYASFTLYAANFVGDAPDEAARYAIVRGSTWNGSACSSTATVQCMATAANVTAFVQSILPPGLTSSQLSVTTSWPGATASGSSCDTQNGSNSPNCLVKVQVTYTLTYPLPFLTNVALPMSTTAQMTISQ